MVHKNGKEKKKKERERIDIWQVEKIFFFSFYDSQPDVHFLQWPKLHSWVSFVVSSRRRKKKIYFTLFCMTGTVVVCRSKVMKRIKNSIKKNRKRIEAKWEVDRTRKRKQRKKCLVVFVFLTWIYSTLVSFVNECFFFLFFLLFLLLLPHNMQTVQLRKRD